MKSALIWAVLILLPATLFGEALETAFVPNGGEYLVDRFVVTTRAGVPALTMEQTNSGIAGTGVTTLDNLCAEQQVTFIEPFYPTMPINPIIRELMARMYIFHVAPSKNVQDAVLAFDNTPEIECADLYDIPHPTYTPNDPDHDSQYHLGRIDAYEAWDIIRGDTTAYAIVGISDTGIYWMHPDLEQNMWINVWEDLNGNGIFDIPDDEDGIDDDGNGYVDDVIGWDLGQNDNDPREITPTHGTHVAGCASEATDNNLNGAGVGFSVRIMAVKGANGSNQLTAVYQALIWAVDNGAHIVNASWGSPQYSQGNQNIMNNLWNAGTVIVAAAGNENNSQNFYPASYNNVVAVAATTSQDRRASFSSYGTWVDVSAPGNQIYATWGPSSMTYLSGTSMASPITAGTVGLLRAANPGWTNEDLVNTLISTTDNIDDLNPNYIGQLGSGRINAASALGSGSIPNLQLAQITQTITQGDGDSVLNPGETFNLVLGLHNIWADAQNVSVQISSGNFTITDSTSTYGNILHDSLVNNQSDPFVMSTAADIIPDSLPVTVAISADGPYVDTIFIQVYVSLNQAGFPRDFSDLDSSPLIYDADRDGANEILIGNSGASSAYYVYMIEADGSNSPGWPKQVAAEVVSGPAVGDIDNDGDNEVVAISKDGRFYAWNTDGSLLPNFPVAKGSTFLSGPLLADIDGNGDLEIIAGCDGDLKVYALDHNGSDHPGWPTLAINRWQGSPAAGNFDADPAEEIVYAGLDAALHVWNGDGSEVTGFPVSLSGIVQTSPAVGDVDNDSYLEIVVTTRTGNCYLINHDGSIAPGFPTMHGAVIQSSPSLADLNNDGDLEILFGTNTGLLHVLEPGGGSMAGFPQTLGGIFYNSPIVGDISGDGQPDIIMGSSLGTLHALNTSGNALRNFPIPAEGGSRPIQSSVAVGYLDQDGDMEIVVPVKASGRNLVVIDYKEQASQSNLRWPCFAHDHFRSGNNETVIVSIDDPVVIPETFHLSQNYPNPFNASTSISFALDRDGEATLTIFDLLGRRIRTLHSGLISDGPHAFIWNGRDDAGLAVTSGIYFYKLESAEGILTRKMVMLK